MTALLVAVTTAVILYLFLIFPARRRRDVSFLLGAPIAHRALHSDRCDENSLSALAAAVDACLPAELDVRLSSDGVPIVFHDSTLSRLCGDDCPLCEMTAKQLSQRRLPKSGEHIPTLREALDTVDGKIPLLIELKSSTRAGISRHLAASAVSDVLRDYRGRYAVQSFDPLLLRQARRAMPSVPLGLLADRRRFTEGAHRFAASHLLCNFLCRPDFISYGYTDSLPLSVRLVRRLGAPIIAWTPQSEGEARDAELRFDGVIAEQINEIFPRRDA